jgi:peptidoglycan/LPS O-acetylase OafA/YrhL
MADKPLTKERIFFPNLDGFRFFCFFAVFLFHCNGTILRRVTGYRAHKVLDFLFLNGEVGVNAFFVLSGFLITFLLIKEKRLNNDISLQNFYIRRILRIWPLFYVCVFAGFIIFPYVKFRTIPSPDEIADYRYYIFFLCNFDFIRIWPLRPDAIFLSALWSVAVEEQFYLVWPVILKYSSQKIYPLIFSAIILFTLIFRSFYTGGTDADLAMRNFNTFSVIGDMALGGMVAYYCSYESGLFKFIRNVPRWQIAVVYCLTIIFILFKKSIFAFPVFSVLERVVLASCFAFIIAEQNFADNSIIKFSRFKVISKLGTYTYGLYCLHLIALAGILFIIEKYGWKVNTLFSCLIACILALGISITLSWLSYHYFEKYFLKLKDKFSFIVKN